MKLFRNIALAALAIVTFASCDCQKAPKFDAKEYAKHKTDRIDQIVDLSDAQEEEVYALFLEQGKQIKKNIKKFKQECGEVKCPDGKGAKCDKPAGCPEGKAECDKAAKCCKPECDKAAKCCKAECKGDSATCEQKGECKKAKCDKAECDKAAKCCGKDAKCDKPRKHHRRHPAGINPEEMKALHEKINTILTPEQIELLKAHKAQRFQCAPNAEKCCPSEK